VFVGNGSDEALALCTRAFVENDGSIGYFDPSYSLYPVLAAIRDVETRPVPLADDFGWRMDDGYACSLFFLTNPNAPTGILHPREVVRSFCRRLDGVVVVDEAYVDFAREHCMGLALELPNVLVLRTLSKSFSLAGLRLGYAVGHARLVEALFKIKDSYNVDMLSQRVARAAFSDLDHMRANAEKIRATRARLCSGLARLGHVVYPSEANFVWVRPAGMAAVTLFAKLRERNILVRHFPGPRTGDCVRITIGTDAQIDRLLDVMTALKRGETR
jgi:histidinol-phosphate aminotransferase